MKKRTFAYVVIVCFGLFPFLHAENADVSGKWELAIQSPRGELTRDVTFVQEGDKLTVTMEGMRGGGELTGEGTITDSTIEWSVTRETPRGEFTMTYTGTVSGNTMSGKVQMMNRTVEWSANKKQD
jgi:hypothetical protein